MSRYYRERNSRRVCAKPYDICVFPAFDVNLTRFSSLATKIIMLATASTYAYVMMVHAFKYSSKDVDASTIFVGFLQFIVAILTFPLFYTTLGTCIARIACYNADFEHYSASNYPSTWVECIDCPAVSTLVCLENTPAAIRALPTRVSDFCTNSKEKTKSVLFNYNATTHRKRVNNTTPFSSSTLHTVDLNNEQTRSRLIIEV